MKPETYFIDIINAVSEPSRIKEGKMRQVIHPGNQTEPMTLFLHEGTLAIYRNKDHLLIRYIHAPMVVGMNDLIDLNMDIYMKACGKVRYEIIPRREVLDTIERENLWRAVAYACMYGVKRLMEAHQTAAGLTTYELIRINLSALMAEKEELRLTINASDYIQEKTTISRSRVMKILGDLRIGGHIEIKRGILMGINKLPENY